LSQAPFVISTLEVLQNCPTQKSSLLAAIGGIDPSDSNFVVFNHKNHTPKLPPQLAFMIQVVVRSKTIHQTIVDECALTCIMSPSCWKAIGSSQLNLSPTTLKAFNGRGLKPYGILNTLQLELARKMVWI